MTIQQGANLYTQGFGSRPENVEVPFVTTVNPSSTNTNYPIGKRWINTASGNIFTLSGITTMNGVLSARWELSTPGSGELVTITTQDATIVTPVSGNINLSGASGQLTTTGSGDTAFVAIANPCTTPGDFTCTGTLTANAGLIVAAGNETILNGELFLNAGSITLTDGDLFLNTNGNKLRMSTGLNAAVGISDPMSGAPATVTVTTTACTASSIILFSRATAGGLLGDLSCPVAGVTNGSFIITSTGAETSTIFYFIIN